MPVNGSALYLWKTFRFPNGLKVSSQEDFENRILSRAEQAGIRCFISHEQMSMDSFTYFIGLNVTDCILISEFPSGNKKRGLIGSFFNRIVEGNNGDFVITFSDEGNYRFMNVSRSTSHGSLLDLCEGASSETEPVCSNWTTVMEDILEDVVRSCQ